MRFTDQMIVDQMQCKFCTDQTKWCNRLNTGACKAGNLCFLDFCIEFWNSTFSPVLEYTEEIFVTTFKQTKQK